MNWSSPREPDTPIMGGESPGGSPIGDTRETRETVEENEAEVQ
jgi:hypothetical protein